jgi:hypothetical protein
MKERLPTLVMSTAFAKKLQVLQHTRSLTGTRITVEWDRSNTLGEHGTE